MEQSHGLRSRVALSEIEQQSGDRKTAYATGSYSQREIAEHFHCRKTTKQYLGESE